MWKKFRFVGLALVLSLSLLLAACSGGDNSGSKDSSKAVGDQVDWQITGIDPGAGIMQATDRAIKEYGLDKWKLKQSSGAAMTAQLKRKYQQKDPIIITGWTPHWMFQKFDLKFLKDPKNVYGDAEAIHTVTRKGFKQDNPGAAKILDQFHWSQDDMGKVMLATADGKKPEEAAKEWVKKNQDKVKEWTKGAKKGNGKEVKIVYVAWDSAVASTNVIKTVLEDMGYKVTLKQVEAGPAFAGLSDGSVDAITCVWLPVTHKSYWDKYKSKLVDLGPNLKGGAKTGLVVPKYMKDVNSIEDLKAK
ncbi:glycine betaine/proline transport system substrate-binding protein [Scopulibacillus darangshiensis]|uniref:Glycine betaine/proline transport system substrate-binding protein n=1 Tax=Scopulibacillus darangshiensis TaxID=442528 RepID=A0A4R2P4W2_9BACL|nr:glycine betaine ABC transporter substrate-binding protein [Scopulibacillus darangshiensis]TCP28805.1 glycine betaine/proline transport system substrate-binding protein [Scopulibacillus darangshiensis]